MATSLLLAVSALALGALGQRPVCFGIAFRLAIQRAQQANAVATVIRDDFLVLFGEMAGVPGSRWANAIAVRGAPSSSPTTSAPLTAPQRAAPTTSRA